MSNLYAITHGMLTALIAILVGVTLGRFFGFYVGIAGFTCEVIIGFYHFSRKLYK